MKERRTAEKARHRNGFGETIRLVEANLAVEIKAGSEE
jgi:hypothetical protein